jgi:hypothetical protein
MAIVCALQEFESILKCQNDRAIKKTAAIFEAKLYEIEQGEEF